MVYKRDLAKLTMCSPMRNHPTSQKAVADTLKILAEGQKDSANKHMAKTGLYPIDVSCAHCDLYMLMSCIRTHSGVLKALIYTVLSQWTASIRFTLASSAATPSL
jgi:hypothetical protein